MTEHTATADLMSLLKTFADLPASYRSAPFLVLNDQCVGEAGEARTTEAPELITEHFTPREFEIVRYPVNTYETAWSLIIGR